MNNSIKKYLKEETKRQKEHFELIASENFVNDDILELQGSILTNKYAEGYPGKRYYGGCEYVDKIEQLAIDNAKKLFSAEHANVQPHSGSQANAAAYLAFLNPGDKILGMSLNSGGHLTHGYHISFSGIYYKSFTYEVSEKNLMLDYSEILEVAKKIKPKLIIAGASSYSREIDFFRFRKICDEVNAYLMVDMAHIAGLVAAKIHSSPVPYADVITSTTHKTLRGPRSGLILTKEKYRDKVDKAVFPGTQGGPLMHVIAAKAQAFIDAQKSSFVEYQKQVVNNSSAMADEFMKSNCFVTTNGTDNHLFLVDVKKSFGLTGKFVENALEKINITLNKNGLPFDVERPFITSGIRIGTPAMTTKGFTEEEFRQVARIIIDVCRNFNSKKILNKSKNNILKLLKKKE